MDESDKIIDYIINNRHVKIHAICLYTDPGTVSILFSLGAFLVKEKKKRGLPFFLDNWILSGINFFPVL